MPTCDYCGSAEVREISPKYGPYPPNYECRDCYIKPLDGLDWDDHPLPPTDFVKQLCKARKRTTRLVELLLVIVVIGFIIAVIVMHN